MKRQKLSLLLTLCMCLELIIAPVAAETSKGQQTWNTVNQVLDKATQGYNTVMGQGQGGAFTQQMNKIQESRMPTLDRKYNLTELAKVPEFVNFLKLPENKKYFDMANGGNLNCYTLPKDYYKSYPEVCRMGVSPTAGDGKAQADEAFAYYNQYLQLSDSYTKMSQETWAYDPQEQPFSISNPQQLSSKNTGYECMKNVAEVMEAFFSYRKNELVKVQNDLKKIHDNFKELAKSDLGKIEEISAVLGGEEHPSANKVASSPNSPKDIFDYGKRLNDPACTSMLDLNSIQEKGKARGLSGISKDFTTTYNAPPGDGSPYSPKEYLKNHANVVKDIKDMADSISKDVKRNFSSISNKGANYGQFLSTLKNNASTQSGVQNQLTPDFFAKTRDNFVDKRDKLSSQVASIGAEIGNDPALASLGDIENNDTFDTEVDILENRLKSQCLTAYPIDAAVERIYNPKLSKEANKASTDQFKDRIKSIIKDIKKTPEKKMEELNSLGVLDSGYIVKRDGPHEVEYEEGGVIKKKKVDASVPLSPKSYFNDLITSCDAKFSQNAVSRKMSGKKVISQLKNLKKEYKKLADDHANEVKKQIIDKMVKCSGSDAVSTDQVAGSCKADRFSMRTPSSNFCAEGAKMCATNMKECTTKTEKMVTDMKSERSDRAKKYNHFMEKHRKDLVNTFQSTLKKFEKDGEVLRGLFGKGFNSPTGMETNIEPAPVLDGFLPEDQMNLTNPDQYLELMNQNVGKLIKSVEEQQTAIQNDPEGPSRAHAEKRKGEYAKIASEIKSKAEECQRKHDDFIKGTDADTQKQQQQFQEGLGELGEKSGELCGLWSSMMSDSPDGSCKEDIKTTTSETLKAASKINPSLKPLIIGMRTEMEKRCKGAKLAEKLSEWDAIKICATKSGTEISELEKRMKSPGLISACKLIADKSDESAKDDQKYCKRLPKLELSCPGCYSNPPTKTIDDFIKESKNKYGYGTCIEDSGAQKIICSVPGENTPADNCDNLKTIIQANWQAIVGESYEAPDYSGDIDVSPLCPDNNGQQYNSKDSESSSGDKKGGKDSKGKEGG